FFVNVELTVDVTHLLRVVEDQCDEDVDRSLVGEPETERVVTQRDTVECRGEQNACAGRDQEPDDQDLGQQAQYRSPVRLAVMFHHVSSLKVLLASLRNRPGAADSYYCRRIIGRLILLIAYNA